MFTGTKIVAVARNYARHAAEMGAAAPPSLSFFLKPPSAVVFAPGPIVRPLRAGALHHEVELGAVIGARCARARAADWRAYVRGYVLGLDMTARDAQAAAKRAGLPWAAAKGFDTAAPLSAEVRADAVPDPHTLELWLAVDGAPRQRGATSEMLVRLPELLAGISAVMTLEPGDIILTGTPEGVGAVEPGQVITAGVAGRADFDVRFDVVEGL